MDRRRHTAWRDGRVGSPVGRRSARATSTGEAIFNASEERPDLVRSDCRRDVLACRAAGVGESRYVARTADSTSFQSAVLRRAGRTGGLADRFACLGHGAGTRCRGLRRSLATVASLSSAVNRLSTQPTLAPPTNMKTRRTSIVSFALLMSSATIVQVSKGTKYDPARLRSSSNNVEANKP